MCTKSSNFYLVRGLSEEDSLSLFFKLAFKEGEEKNYPQLLEIAREIVKKCGRIPLAVKTLRVFNTSSDATVYNKEEIKDIPEGFANLPNLVHLNLSFNQVEGLVSKTGLLAHINASSMMENQNLYGAKLLSPCRETKHSLSKKSIAIIASLGSLATLLVPVFVIPILNREPNSAIQNKEILL
ncbi:hypothetical protein VNO78_12365 [Psophocarpus tetragonolobus]|uniref:Uncharacterized protein n=1 Tax=Psophocarpus tetragonolobus TaxID=3891 RepID=A0AAN9SVQ8_PSOTE